LFFENIKDTNHYFTHSGIKGGGGCLLQEKLVQTCAKRFAVIGGLDKYSKFFGKASKSIPIEIAPLGHAAVQRWIIDKHGIIMKIK
jgi:ribose 5-phosphate isomerase A